MADGAKYEPPEGPPPGKVVHHDAGPYYGSQTPSDYNNNKYQTQNQGEPWRGYGSPPPQQQWGPPQGGYYQPQQQGPMYYGQQPYGSQYGPQYGQPQGYYADRGGGAGGGICAGLLAALACCCCVDFLF